VLPPISSKSAHHKESRGGAQVIFQASLASIPWRGRADVLLPVEQPGKLSRVGPWSYEAVDCKLARETKAETVLQLCLYSELLAELQGLEPEFFHVIRPYTGFEPESYRLASFAAYYRWSNGRCRRRWGAALVVPIQSQSVIAIFADGGRSSMSSGAGTIICHSSLGLPS
jgi:hypothetical protein